jgi:AbiV family abortive infection protein
VPFAKSHPDVGVVEVPLLVRRSGLKDAPEEVKLPSVPDVPDLLVHHLQKTYGAPNPRRALRRDEVVAGLTQIHLNARDLLEDVRVLSAAGRFPRAGALAVLALEELAKVPVLFEAAIVQHRGRRDFWLEFWKDYKNHATKQKRIADYARGLRTAGDGFVNEGPYAHYLPDELGRILDIYKQRNFYVDFWGDSFMRPGEVEEMPNGSVDQLLLLAEERSDSFERLHGTEARSAAFLDAATIAAKNVQSGERPRLEMSLEDMLNVASAEDVRRELHSLIAHRSSADVPDYASVRSVGTEIADICAADVIQEAIQNEGEILARRMRLAEVLPASANRAFAMFKLLLGVAEQLSLHPPKLPESSRP